VAVASAVPASEPSDPVYAISVSPANLKSVSAQVAQSHIAPGDKLLYGLMVAQHLKRPAELQGKTVAEMVSEERAYQMGQDLVRQARMRDYNRLVAIKKLVDVEVVARHDQEFRTTLRLRIHNKTARAIEGVDTGILIYNPAGQRIGMTEIEAEHDVDPHGTATFPVVLPYLKFGENAGVMRLAAGKPKRVDLLLKIVKFADGTESGTDE
jgi:hypothetical protein